MSAAVERVAEALSRGRGCDHAAPCEFCEQPLRLENDSAGCMRLARIALAALREPDEAMWAAGAAAMDIASHDDAGLVWMRMVDAALSAPQSGCEGGYSDAGKKLSP